MQSSMCNLKTDIFLLFKCQTLVLVTPSIQTQLSNVQRHVNFKKSNTQMLQEVFDQDWIMFSRNDYHMWWLYGFGQRKVTKGKKESLSCQPAFLPHQGVPHVDEVKNPKNNNNNALSLAPTYNIVNSTHVLCIFNI